MASRNLLRQLEGLYPSSGPFQNGPIALDAEFRTKYMEVWDDFAGERYVGSGTVLGNLWAAKNDGGTGTNAFQDLAGGVIGVVTAAADNDYNAIYTATKCVLPVAEKPIWFEARFKLTEANTKESAWWFGVSDTVATTGGLQAHASGPLASYDGILIWKDENTMDVDFETSITTTQATTSAIATFVSNTWTRVGFYCNGDATYAAVVPFVDIGSGWIRGEQQLLTLSGLNPMAVVAGVKAGPSAGAETLMIDYIRCVQLR